MFFSVLIFFILGSAVGSFLNVVIDRTTRGQSILGRSYCDRCRATLSAVDLIPIVSFVALGGRCRNCQGVISWQYWFVEGVTGVLFAISFVVLVQESSLSLVPLTYRFFLISILIIVAAVDLKFSLIPTSFVFFASLVALFYNFFLLPPGLFVEHALVAFGAAIFFLLIVVLTRGRGMGEGDIILVFLIGLVLGFKATLIAIFIAFLTGAVVAISLIILGKKRFGQTIPFAPFLVWGFILSFFWAKPILAWYLMIY